MLICYVIFIHILQIAQLTVVNLTKYYLLQIWGSISQYIHYGLIFNCLIKSQETTNSDAYNRTRPGNRDCNRKKALAKTVYPSNVSVATSNEYSCTLNGDLDQTYSGSNESTLSCPNSKTFVLCFSRKTCALKSPKNCIVVNLRQCLK